MNAKEIVSKMSFEEKAWFLTGAGSDTIPHEKYGLKKIRLIDGCHGVRENITAINGESCVCYPCPAAMGSSWDKEEVYKTAQAIARDCKALNYDMLLGPGVNMKRSPYGGRNFDYYAEDPVLAGELAAAFINGLESEGIAACAKHYAANNQEFERSYINADIDERTLREYYLRAFQITLKYSKPASVMCAYNKVNGIHCSENKFLLTDVLKDEWGFDGMVISDWGAVHDCGRSIASGLDFIKPPRKAIAREFSEGLEAGKVTMEQIDKAVETMIEFVRRVSSMKRKDAAYNRAELHEAATEMARKSITLLKNADNVLPISERKYKKILVAGMLAERPVIQGSGASKIEVADKYIDTPLEYIKKYAGELGIEVDYDPVYKLGYMGAEQIAALNSMSPSDYDAVIVFIGDNYGGETETEHWDRDNIVFSNYLNGMVNAAVNKCENVITVMQTGAATVPVRWHEVSKGIIQMWYAGEGGGKALADILFGRVNPSAKLSETFITKARDMDVIGDGSKTLYSEGLFVGYRYYDQNPAHVWFPFGHGISYTTFEYSDLCVDKTLMKDGDKVIVTLTVKNTGEVDGSEIVQLYIHQKGAIVTKPHKELKSFEKVFIKAGESKTVTFELDRFDFEYYNLSYHKWHVESGTYCIMVGASSADIRLKKEIAVSTAEDYSKPGRAVKYQRI